MYSLRNCHVSPSCTAIVYDSSSQSIARKYHIHLYSLGIFVSLFFPCDLSPTEDKTRYILMLSLENLACIQERNTGGYYRNTESEDMHFPFAYCFYFIWCTKGKCQKQIHANYVFTFRVPVVLIILGLAYLLIFLTTLYPGFWSACKENI